MPKERYDDQKSQSLPKEYDKLQSMKTPDESKINESTQKYTNL